MATFDLVAQNATPDIQIIAAIESTQVGILQVGFWVNDPNQRIIWPATLAKLSRQDFLWRHSCFELFIGVKNHDLYREINLSRSNAWQAYQFEEYRYPEDSPPQQASDIELISLNNTRFGITAVLDINPFLHQHNLKMKDLFIGTTSVINTATKPLLFAMQHSTVPPDFHNKRDWLLWF